MICIRCGSKNVKKNGTSNGKQQYKCKSCDYQFDEDSRKIKGKTMATKVLALYLYFCGLKMKDIAKILEVSNPSVSNWLKYFSDKVNFKLQEKYLLHNKMKLNSKKRLLERCAKYFENTINDIDNKKYNR